MNIVLSRPDSVITIVLHIRRYVMIGQSFFFQVKDEVGKMALRQIVFAQDNVGWVLILMVALRTMLIR